MYEPLPILVENSIQIAWDYLERTGELGNPEVPEKFRQARRKATTPGFAEDAKGSGKRWMAVSAIALIIAISSRLS